MYLGHANFPPETASGYNNSVADTASDHALVYALVKVMPPRHWLGLGKEGLLLSQRGQQYIDRLSLRFVICPSPCIISVVCPVQHYTRWSRTKREENMLYFHAHSRAGGVTGEKGLYVEVPLELLTRACGLHYC